MPPTIIDSSRQQSRFLAAFGACANVLRAARWAKINRQCHYNWLKEDPTYAARFQEATERAARSLEDEAVRRAHEGLRKPVRYKGKIVGYDTEYSDSLLLALLKANNPEKFMDRSAEKRDLRFVDADGKDRPGPQMWKYFCNVGLEHLFFMRPVVGASAEFDLCDWAHVTRLSRSNAPG